MYCKNPLCRQKICKISTDMIGIITVHCQQCKRINLIEGTDKGFDSISFYQGNINLVSLNKIKPHFSNAFKCLQIGELPNNITAKELEILKNLCKSKEQDENIE